MTRHEPNNSGWWFGTFFIFPYIGLLIIPIDVHIFQRGGPTTNQNYFGRFWSWIHLYKQVPKCKGFEVLRSAKHRELGNMSMSVPRSANATRLPIGADCNAIIADVSFDSMGMNICSIKNEYSMNLYGLISRMIRYHVYFLSADIHIYTYMKLHMYWICQQFSGIIAKCSGLVRQEPKNNFQPTLGFLSPTCICGQLWRNSKIGQIGYPQVLKGLVLNLHFRVQFNWKKQWYDHLAPGRRDGCPTSYDPQPLSTHRTLGKADQWPPIRLSFGFLFPFASSESGKPAFIAPRGSQHP